MIREEKRGRGTESMQAVQLLLLLTCTSNLLGTVVRRARGKPRQRGYLSLRAFLAAASDTDRKERTSTEASEHQMSITSSRTKNRERRVREREGWLVFLFFHQCR